MQPSRETTVMFADVSGSSRLYEEAGDDNAVDAIGRCIQVMHRAVEEVGGRVVKTIGDELMALFSTPDGAADAAARMHLAIDALPDVRGHKLGLRIGFQAGPIIQRDNDVFGDTVNLAARLVEQATKGQVLTSSTTVSLLTPALRNFTRRLYDITVKGKVQEIELCELLWQVSPDVTDHPATRAAFKPARISIRLRFRGKDVIRRRLSESLTFGRDPNCEFVILSSQASRHHCTIERRQNQFVLSDHSSNGTYLRIDGERDETVLHREEFTLRKHGWLSFGQPAAESQELLEYWCE